MQQFHALMSEDERERAARFRIGRVRSRFINRRGLLRILLAQYAECDPSALRFTQNQWGKPTLTGGGTARLQFNASHSDGVALVAVTLDSAVGIDVERHRLDVDCLELADRFFSPDEADRLRRADEPLRRTLFFTLWCCKEAWVKARGLGLSFPLRRCRISVAEGVPQLCEDPEQWGESARWSLTQLTAGPEYSAALVVESHPPARNR
jgi:4'-phosphopantetheinyl transferase